MTEAWLERKGRRRRRKGAAQRDIDFAMDPNTGRLLPLPPPGSFTQV